MDALQALIKHPAHIAAKHRQAVWLKGYQVVIAEVVKFYGKGGISHPLAHRSPDPGVKIAGVASISTT